MFLQVCTVSDIVTADGRFIRRSAWKGLRDECCRLPYQWPRTVCPTRQHWDLWQTTLSRALLASNGPHHPLQQPLGPWTDRLEDWNWLLSPTTGLFHRQIQDEIKECENQVNDVREFVANLDDNENKNDESDDNLDESSDNDNYENDEVNKQDIFSPRKTRSGKSYVQDGIKMRPTNRDNRNQSRCNQQYLNQKKPKGNLLKNRSALRKKEKVKKLKGYLNEIISMKENSRKRIPKKSQNTIYYSNRLEMTRKANMGEIRQL
ncbi:unnamed protein product [Cylindrotheca closterium]|uniref:Uncharacterized protein n=1 Tax=Cylindrotheca closterium TaxID=2856 RepID=A0AAD2CR10_9STRA|nr:unnamed protein product [Cylindrotheca closterium]